MGRIAFKLVFSFPMQNERKVSQRIMGGALAGSSIVVFTVLNPAFGVTLAMGAAAAAGGIIANVAGKAFDRYCSPKLENSASNPSRS